MRPSSVSVRRLRLVAQAAARAALRPLPQAALSRAQRLIHSAAIAPAQRSAVNASAPSFSLHRLATMPIVPASVGRRALSSKAEQPPQEEKKASSAPAEAANPTAAPADASAAAGASTEGAQASGQRSKARSADESTPIGWSMVVFAVVAGGATVVMYSYLRENKQAGDANLKKTESVGQALVGGPYALLSSDGKIVKHSDFPNEYQLIYFGFTHCPDVCPSELRKMGKVIDMLDAKGIGPVRPIFISVDPKRDTVEALNKYKLDYHPKTVWLTGKPEEIKAIARAFRCFYMEAPAGADGNYLVDHSIFFYLLDKNGQFLDTYGKQYTAQEVTDKITAAIARNEANPRPAPAAAPAPAQAAASAAKPAKA